jgi:hypothetical protein
MIICNWIHDSEVTSCKRLVKWTESGFGSRAEAVGRAPAPKKKLVERGLSCFDVAALKLHEGCVVLGHASFFRSFPQSARSLIWFVKMDLCV